MTLKQQPACPKQFNSGFIDLQTHKGHIFTQMNWSWTALPLHCAQRDPSHKVSLLSVRVTWTTSQNKKIKATFHFRKCLSVRPGSLSSSLDFHEYICMNLLLIFILKKKKKPPSTITNLRVCYYRFFFVSEDFSRALFHTCETPPIQLVQKLWAACLKAVGFPSSRHALKGPLHHSSISQMFMWKTLQFSCLAGGSTEALTIGRGFSPLLKGTTKLICHHDFLNILV